MGQLTLEGGAGNLLGRVHTYQNGGCWTEHWVTSNVSGLMATSPLKIAYNSTDPTNGKSWADTIAWYQNQGFNGSQAPLECAYRLISQGTPGSSGSDGTV